MEFCDSSWLNQKFYTAEYVPWTYSNELPYVSKYAMSVYPT